MSQDVIRNAEESRYEIRVDGELAGLLEYREDGPVIALTHTEVFEEFAGQGLAGTLVADALDDIRERSSRVAAECPYVASFIEKNPGYADLLSS